MNFSYETMALVLNGERDLGTPEIHTEAQLNSIIDMLFTVFEKYKFWTYEDFENAVEFFENAYESRQKYFNTTHKGIFERMKEHISHMSFGERLVRSVLIDENYSFKQECYIGHSQEDIHSGSIRLDFVVFYNNVLYVIE